MRLAIYVSDYYAIGKDIKPGINNHLMVSVLSALNDTNIR